LLISDILGEIKYSSIIYWVRKVKANKDEIEEFNYIVVGEVLTIGYNSIKQVINIETLGIKGIVLREIFIAKLKIKWKGIVKF